MLPRAEASAAVPLNDSQTGTGSLASLLQFEADVRRQASLSELCYFVANDMRRIVDYDQAFIVREAMTGGVMRVLCVSSVAIVDRNAPLIQTIERSLAEYARQATLATAAEPDLNVIASDSGFDDYPFRNWFWQPMLDRSGAVFGGVLLVRNRPFTEPEKFRISRVAETIAHAWLALTANRPVRRIWVPNSRQRRWMLLGLGVIALFPVRMSALAPMEVVAARPYVISAPFAGVIREITVAPNAMVSQGQPVLVFEDVKVRNELAQAQERLAVAQAKLNRATSAAFSDKEQSRDVAQLRAEVDVARSDYAYAQDVMARSQVLAPRSGMAIFSDRRDWEGRAVNVGDPVMQIVDARDVAFHIELPAKEQLKLTRGAPVKIWLDAQPLWALRGRIVSASYQARNTPEGVLSFAVTARPDGDAPRIGSRGTAKLYGSWAPLIYAALRRPLGSLRQSIGL